MTDYKIPKIFKREDFRVLKDKLIREFVAPNDEEVCAHFQQIFESWVREKCIPVYGHSDQDMQEWFTYNDNNITHHSLMFPPQEIVAEVAECEHTFIEDIGAIATEKGQSALGTCKDCGVRMKAKWEEV